MLMSPPKRGGRHGAKGAKENQEGMLLNLQGGHLATISEAPFEGLQLDPHGPDLALLESAVL